MKRMRKTEIKSGKRINRNNREEKGVKERGTGKVEPK
jgi:hypothetical protein